MTDTKRPPVGIPDHFLDWLDEIARLPHRKTTKIELKNGSKIYFGSCSEILRGTTIGLFVACNKVVKRLGKSAKRKISKCR